MKSHITCAADTTKFIKGQTGVFGVCPAYIGFGTPRGAFFSCCCAIRAGESVWCPAGTPDSHAWHPVYVKDLAQSPLQ